MSPAKVGCIPCLGGPKRSTQQKALIGNISRCTYRRSSMNYSFVYTIKRIVKCTLLTEKNKSESASIHKEEGGGARGRCRRFVHAFYHITSLLYWLHPLLSGFLLP